MSSVAWKGLIFLFDIHSLCICSFVLGTTWVRLLLHYLCCSCYLKMYSQCKCIITITLIHLSPYFSFMLLSHSLLYLLTSRSLSFSVPPFVPFPLYLFCVCLTFPHNFSLCLFSFIHRHRHTYTACSCLCIGKMNLMFQQLVEIHL